MKAPATIPRRRAMKGSTLRVLIRRAKIQDANAKLDAKERSISPIVTTKTNGITKKIIIG